MNNIEQQIYNKIVGANKEYRQGTPIMSDFAYDVLVDELRTINPDHEWFKIGRVSIFASSATEAVEEKS